jgi:hypothetical protein
MWWIGSRAERGRARSARALLGTVAALAALAACNSGSGPPPPLGASLRVLHTIYNGPPLNVVVDGRSAATSLRFGQLTRGIPLSLGDHSLDPQPPDTTRHLSLVFATSGGINYDAFVLDSIAGANHIIDPVVVPDTGAVPATGHGRLRLANFAALPGPIDAYRSEPGSTSLLLTQQPFNFRAVTRYFDSSPGKWTVVISHGGVRDTLLATDSIAVTDGQARTVAIVDSTAGRVSWRVRADQ